MEGNWLLPIDVLYEICDLAAMDRTLRQHDQSLSLLGIFYQKLLLTGDDHTRTNMIFLCPNKRKLLSCSIKFTALIAARICELGFEGFEDTMPLTPHLRSTGSTTFRNAMLEADCALLWGSRDAMEILDVFTVFLKWRPWLLELWRKDLLSSFYTCPLKLPQNPKTVDHKMYSVGYTKLLAKMGTFSNSLGFRNFIFCWNTTYFIIRQQLASDSVISYHYLYNKPVWLFKATFSTSIIIVPRSKGTVLLVLFMHDIGIQFHAASLYLLEKLFTLFHLFTHFLKALKADPLLSLCIYHSIQTRGGASGFPSFDCNDGAANFFVTFPIAV